MSQPADWEPLAPRDPVPGDVTEIAKLTRRYSDTAEAIRARPVSCASTMAGR